MTARPVHWHEGMFLRPHHFQAVQVRLLNLRLLLSTDDQAGYETIPIARIEKSARAEAVPQLDVSYIPPMLACVGQPDERERIWPTLLADVLRYVYDRFGKK